ncbi:MAG: hypothetical protein AAF658_13035, partial [Myxococcota bacterium]
MIALAVSVCFAFEAQAQVCPDEEPGAEHPESFADASTEGEESIVSGWGSGEITLQRKGAAFDVSTQAVGLKLTGIAYGDFDGD